MRLTTSGRGSELVFTLAWRPFTSHPVSPGLSWEISQPPRTYLLSPAWPGGCQLQPASTGVGRVAGASARPAPVSSEEGQRVDPLVQLPTQQERGAHPLKPSTHRDAVRGMFPRVGMDSGQETRQVVESR